MLLDCILVVFMRTLTNQIQGMECIVYNKYNRTHTILKMKSNLNMLVRFQNLMQDIVM